MLSVIYAECHTQALYADCRYDECLYAECHLQALYADCRYSGCRGADVNVIKHFVSTMTVKK